MRASETLLRAGLLLVCIVAGDAWAALSARLDRERIAEGETVQLTVETDGQVSGSPDTSPLEAEFEILGVASGSQVSIVNGRMTTRTSWTITLAPKSGGTLTIPPLEVEGERSAPLSLHVGEAPVAAEPAAGHPIFIETEVDRTDPYVQGMVRYTVRLFHRVKLADGSLSEPRLDNALIRRLGRDREYTVERDGFRFRVIEREYAVFPQSSGDLVIPGPVLDARIPDKSSPRRSPFKGFLGRDPFDDPFFSGSPLGDAFTVTRPVRVRGEKLVVNVQPRPNQADASHWLPAERVELSESWQPENGGARVGDPLTRTINIRALGLTGEQLPDLLPPDASGFKVYPDAPKVETREIGGSVEGEKTRSIAYVPVQPGRFTLPGVRLHWWDTLSDRERVAELPERTVEVLPGVGEQRSSIQPSGAVQKSGDQTPAATAVAGRSEPAEGAAASEAVGPGIWPWVSAFFAVLWIFASAGWWRARRNHVGTIGRSSEDSGGKEDIRRAERSVLSACRANDPASARRSLLEWASARWPDNRVTGLDDLSRRIDDTRVQRALTALDQSLYSGGGTAWNGGELANLVTRLSPGDDRPMEGTGLPGLYT